MSDIYRNTGRPSTTRVTVVNSRSEPASQTAFISVDRVHSMIRAAEAGDTRPLFALYRDILLSDSHIQGELSKRKLAVLGEEMRFLPVPKGDKAAALSAAFCSDLAANLPSFQACMVHLLDACLWPVAVVEKVYAPSKLGNGTLRVEELVPVPHHHLDYWQGKLRIAKVDESGVITSEFFEPDPAIYIVHRGHLLSTPDNFGGPFRSLVFWWLLSALSKDWWARFLDKYGSPFLVGKYDSSDDAARTTLESAFAWASRIGGIVVSNEASVEIKQAAASDSGAAYKTFLEVCNREKSKLILGHALSADAQATGMNSGQANNASDVADSIHKFDATALARTLRTQLFDQAVLVGGLNGQTPEIAWGTVTIDELKADAEFLTAATAAGLEIDDKGLAELNERSPYQFRRAAGLAPSVPVVAGAAPASAPTEEVAKTALNAIQIDALKGLATDAAAGLLPLDAAKVIARASFPGILPADIDAIFVSLSGFKPAAPSQPSPPATFAASPSDPVDALLASSTKAVSRTLRDRYAEVLRLLRDAPDPATFTASVAALLESSPGTNPALEALLQTSAAAGLASKP